MSFSQTWLRARFWPQKYNLENPTMFQPDLEANDNGKPKICQPAYIPANGTLYQSPTMCPFPIQVIPAIQLQSGWKSL